MYQGKFAKNDSDAAKAPVNAELHTNDISSEMLQEAPKTDTPVAVSYPPVRRRNNPQQRKRRKKNSKKGTYVFYCIYAAFI